jgi:hypothetical protein
MKILVPKTLYVPSGCGSARVRTMRQVAAGLWLGQVHGAGPLAADQLFQVGCLQLVEPAVSSASMAPSLSNGHSAKLMLAC